MKMGDDEAGNSSSFGGTVNASTFTSRYLLDFKPLKHLGAGAFGNVFAAQNHFDTKVYAVKRTGLSEEDGESAEEKVRTEVIALASLNHVNVVRYYNAWMERPPDGWLAENDPLWENYQEDLQRRQRFVKNSDSTNMNLLYRPFHLYIQQELCPGGSMRDWMLLNTDRSEVMKLLLQIVTALEYIHSKGMIHRDLKPENILVFFNLTDPVDQLTLKVADFGLASLKFRNQSSSSETSEASLSLGDTNAFQLTAGRGTRPYMSPEQSQSQYNSKADMWAVGVIAFELTYVHEDDKKRYRKIAWLSATGQFPEDFQSLYPFEHKLIASLLNTNPAERPSATEIVEQLKSHLHKTIKLPLFHNVGEKKDVFPGRTLELQRLQDTLIKKEDARPEFLSICGMAGVGKTELAKQFVYQAFSDLQWSVVWIHGDGEESFRRSSIAFAQDCLNINITCPNGKGFLSLPEIYKLIHQTLKGTRWILIVDNVDQLLKGQDLDQVLSDFTKYPPPKPFVLITSRDTSLRCGITNIPIDILSDEDAQNLVSATLQSSPDLPEEVLQDDSAVQKLCQVLQNFPLALTQATAYISAQNEDSLDSFTVNDYLKTYEKENHNLLGFEVDSLKHDYALTTLTTWNTTLKLLTTTRGEVGHVAVEVLDLLAYCDSDDIPLDFILDTLSIAVYGSWTNYMYISEDNVKKAIVLLKKFSLCKFSQPSKTLSVHRLVQQIMRLKLTSQGSASSPSSQEFVQGLVPLKTEDVWLRQLLKVLVNRHNKTNGEFPRKDFLPHIAQLWRHAQTQDELMHRYGFFPAWIASSFHHYHMYKTALEFSQNTYKLMRNHSVHTCPENPHFLLVMFTIGNAYGRSLWALGRNEEQMILLSQLFTEQQAALTMKHPLTIQTGISLLWMNNWKRSNPNYLEVARTLRDSSVEVNGEKHEMTIQLDNFLLMEETSKSDSDLGAAWERYLTIQKKFEMHSSDAFLSPERITTALTLIRLVKLSDPDNAFAVKEILEDLLQDVLVQYGEESQLTQQVQLTLAMELDEQGNNQKCNEIFSQVWQVQKRTLGEDHSITTITKDTLVRSMQYNVLRFMIGFTGYLVKNDLKIDKNTDPAHYKKLLDEFGSSFSTG